jgi:ubiquinone/menaquinone biosynthesis C-methylase UbiE
MDVPATTGSVPSSPDRFWNLYSRYYDCVFQLMPYRKLLWDVYQALELRPGMRVLDAGCGTGNFEVFIAEKNPPSIRVDAVDFSPAMLAVASGKCSALGNVSFHHADLSAALPFEDETFDRILSINVLYALPDLDATMREFLRVLKPEGQMVLTSPAPEFSATPLLADHLRRIGNIWGFKRKAVAVLDTLTTSATSGVCSAVLNYLVINRREFEGRYRSLGPLEVRDFLERHEPGGVAEFGISRAMADQNVLATATKMSASARERPAGVSAT